MVERRGGKSLNKEASWSPLFGGAQREGKSLNQEASWRPLFGGAQGGEKFKANERYHPTHPPNPPQATCVPQISVCSKLILIGFPLCSKMTLNGHFPVCSKMTLIVCSKMTRVPLCASVYMYSLPTLHLIPRYAFFRFSAAIITSESADGAEIDRCEDRLALPEIQWEDVPRA